jgi:hypothetical protein
MADAMEHDSDGSEAESAYDEDEEGDEDDLSYASGSDEDDSSYMSDLSERGTLLQAIGGYRAKTPRQKFEEFLEKIISSKSKVFKITDEDVLDYNLFAVTATASTATTTEQQLLQQARQQEEQQQQHQLQQAPLPLHQELVEAVSSSTGLTHAILGHKVLQLLGPTGQLAVLQACCRHDSLLFLKLGTDHSMQTGILCTSAILQALIANKTPVLSEMEFRGVTLQNNAEVQQLVTCILQRTTILRQLNLLGLEFPNQQTQQVSVTHCHGFLDPLLNALSQVEPLDELKLIGLGHPTHSTLPPNSVITSHALRDLLQVKKKWWRLVLDGMGLDDGHCHVMVELFARDDTCKAGDLLSLQQNPAVSESAIKQMAALFFRKRRMGAIKVDCTCTSNGNSGNGGIGDGSSPTTTSPHAEWEHKFDLVRSMNNLHSRMDYIDGGAFVERSKWVEWLAKLNKASWADDKHKLNYLWFTLLEKPDMIFANDS